MSEYKVGDKVVLTVTSTNEMGCLPCYVLNDDLILSRQDIDKYSEPLSTYTEPLEDKIKKLMEENLWLIAENTKLKAKDDVLKTSCDDYEEKANDMCDTARAEGQNEAWELARKIIIPPWKGGMSSDDYTAIFGSCISKSYVMKNYTYSEAAAKVAEREKAKEEIKVGDVFEFTSGGKAVVMKVYEDGEVALFFPDGGCGIYEPGESWHKTGRHIDIDSFLKQIGGKQE